MKHDGFRALAYIERSACRLVSRNGHEFKGLDTLCRDIPRHLKVRNAILDGELCCLGQDGRSLFNALRFRRCEPYFYAFDLVWVNGRDMRQWPLLLRKEKLRSIIARQVHAAPHETLLVLDATTGQNALQQARAFKDAVKVTGVILAKLDSSARGGMAFAINRELGLPILFAGLGEKPDDLQPFDSKEFVAALFDES